MKIFTILIVGSVCISGLARAESILSCEEVKAKQGITAFMKCVAKQHVKNYLPGHGPGPGMTMDAIGDKADEVSDFCHQEGGLCDGVEAGTRVKDCDC